MHFIHIDDDAETNIRLQLANKTLCGHSSAPPLCDGWGTLPAAFAFSDLCSAWRLGGAKSLTEG